MANKPDKIPSSLRWTTFWIVFALIVLSVALALALYSAGQYLVLLLGVDLQPDAYMLWVPLIALAVSAILGTVLAIVLNRYYLRPVPGREGLVARLPQHLTHQAAGAGVVLGHENVEHAAFLLFLTIFHIVCYYSIVFSHRRSFLTDS